VVRDPCRTTNMRKHARDFRPFYFPFAKSAPLPNSPAQAGNHAVEFGPPARCGWCALIDVELAKQSARLMQARAEAWQRFIRVVHGGGVPETPHDGCAHDLDLMHRCRICGEYMERE
jgi:hypothetical protein